MLVRRSKKYISEETTSISSFFLFQYNVTNLIPTPYLGKNLNYVIYYKMVSVFVILVAIPFTSLLVLNFLVGKPKEVILYIECCSKNIAQCCNLISKICTYYIHLTGLASFAKLQGSCNTIWQTTEKNNTCNNIAHSNNCFICGM